MAGLTLRHIISSTKLFFDFSWIHLIAYLYRQQLSGRTKQVRIIVSMYCIRVDTIINSSAYTFMVLCTHWAGCFTCVMICSPSIDRAHQQVFISLAPWLRVRISKQQIGPKKRKKKEYFLFFVLFYFFFLDGDGSFITCYLCPHVHPLFMAFVVNHTQPKRKKKKRKKPYYNASNLSGNI